MLLSFLCVPNKSCHQIIRSHSSYPQTHYDVLKLKRNCTAQEIREAFITLSKEYHPDAKGAKTSRKDTLNFVKISEAYQVLSKTVTRDAYDQALIAKGIAGSTAATSGGFKKEVHRPWEIKPDYDPNPGPYYGIKGIRRVSNGKIVMVLVAFSVISVGMGFLSAKQSFTFNRAQLDVKSKEAGEHHAAVRADAHKFGNDEQLKRMVDRFLTRPS